MTLQLALLDEAATTFIVDLSDRATNAVIAWNQHGVEKITSTVEMPTEEAFIYFNQAGPLTTQANVGGLTIADARLENPKLTLNGLEIEALGYWAGLGDIPYTALWSSTQTKDWRPTTTQDIASRYSERATFDNNNRIYIAPQKGDGFDNGMMSAQTYVIPYGSSRQIVGISFDYELKAPTSPSVWDGILSTWSYDYVTTIAQPWLLASTGAVQTGTQHFVLAACDRLEFGLYYTGTIATFAGETNSAYLKITNLRVVTSTANRINTTLTVARAAGTSVTATVGSTSGMYVGQQLQIESGTNGETVTVQSITNTTQFVATFTRAHTSGKAVQAHVIRTSEIAADIVSAVNTINPSQLSSSTGGVTATTDDQTDAVYEDRYPSDILIDLAGKLNWAVGVDTARRLYLRPRAGRAWFVDATDLQVQRSLAALRNDAYAVYQDAASNTLRTATNPQATRYSIKRRAAVTVQTTSATLAANQRDTSLLNTRDVLPQASFPFDQIFDESGAAWPLSELRPDDTITIRNLPPDLSSDVNRVTTFRLTRVEWHDDDTVVVEPEAPLPILEAML